MFKHFTSFLFDFNGSLLIPVTLCLSSQIFDSIEQVQEIFGKMFSGIQSEIQKIDLGSFKDMVENAKYQSIEQTN